MATDNNEHCSNKKASEYYSYDATTAMPTLYEGMWAKDPSSRS